MQQKRAWTIYGSVIAGSLLIAALTWLLPVAPAVANPTAEHTRTALAAIAAVCSSATAVWLFFSGKGFKSQLRTAYKLLASGIFILAVALMQLPIAGLFDLWDVAWLAGGGVVLLFIVAGVLVYAGMRRFSRLLSVANALNSFLLVIALVVGFMIVSGIAGTYLITYEFEGGGTYIATIGCILAFYAFSAILAQGIERTIGENYRPAIRSLKIAIGGFAFACLHEYVLTFFVPSTSWYVGFGLYLWPFILASLLLADAGRKLYLLSADTTETADVGENRVASDSDYIDSITTVAQLASRPQEVDTYLDGLRRITASYQPGNALSEADKQQLLGAYRNLEEYLAHNDPLRVFTADEVRRHATPAFRALLARQKSIHS